MKAVIISCSPRKLSESERISIMIKEHLTHFLKVESSILCLHDISECLFNVESNIENFHHVQEIIKESAMLIFVVPEHNGMAPPVLKQLLMIADFECFAHRPVLIIGISSGMGGTYPIVELRATTFKNSHINYIPEHVIIRNVNSVIGDFNDIDVPGLSRRIHACLKILSLYANALSSVREQLLELTSNIKYGM